jgi:type IV pilus assembly protein PilX
MKPTITSPPRRERGIALIAALLILLVITILGMAMFRGFGLQLRLGTNTRDKVRAFTAATTAQNYAEWYLTANNGANSVATTDCTGTAPAAVTTQMVCSNIIPATTGAPDTWGAAFTYNPQNNMVTTAGAQLSYSQLPQFYISYLGAAGTGPSYNSVLGQNNTLFQIDAAGWGATPQAVAVVESAYKVSTISTNIPPTAGSTTQKNVSLGGP